MLPDDPTEDPVEIARFAGMVESGRPVQLRELRLPLRSRLDFKAVAQAAWLPALLWAAAVLGATLSGYPGVICVTPLGWLLALPAGWRALEFSASPSTTARLLEAGLSGALVGAFQGILFALVLTFASPLGIEAESQLNALLSALIALLATGGMGSAAGAALGSGIAALSLRRS